MNTGQVLLDKSFLPTGNTTLDHLLSISGDGVLVKTAVLEFEDNCPPQAEALPSSNIIEVEAVIITAQPEVVVNVT